jgi:mutator protein MutT
MPDFNRLAHFKRTGRDDLYEGCERQYMKKITAAVAIITQEENGKTKILGVSRKDDHEAWGLPGGSIEEGETPEDAMVREVREETGLIVSEARKVFVRIDDWGVAAAAFEVLECFGEPRTVEQGLVRWLDLNELIEEKAPFREYNARLFHRLGWMVDSGACP